LEEILGGGIQSHILHQTYDQEKYDVKIDGDKVKVILPVCG
jgi:hypothetical protein